MEPLDDKELNRLLRQWEAPAAPASLRSPIRHRRLRWLWSGRIQLPVPVGAAIVIAVAFWIYSSRTAPAFVTPSPGEAGNTIASPATTVPASPDPPAAIPATTRTAESAALSGFRPVRQLELKIIQVRP